MSKGAIAFSPNHLRADPSRTAKVIPITPETGSRTGHILTAVQKAALIQALAGKPIALSFGAGVDSTAMLVALHEAGIKPHLITFADTGGEKPETLAHLDKINAVLRSWDWPLIDVVRHLPKKSCPRLTLTCTATAWRTKHFPLLPSA
ncbi:hypothetical protein [Variovorax gossypii]